MINKVLLDCTFRDGGYYNNWNFDINLFNEYLKCMLLCKVDIVEIGFRFKEQNPYYGPFAYSIDSFLKKLNLPKKIKYAVMINAKDFYNRENEIFKFFLKKNKSSVDIVRIAINFKDYKKSKNIIKNLKNLNYQVGLNLMQAHDKSKNDIENLVQDIKKWKIKIDFLYFADSLGCMSTNYIEYITKTFADNWTGSIGIHAHNNKSMALSNTVQSLKSGADICDSTIMGMGRGAGNAQTEFLIQEIKGSLSNSKLKSLTSLLVKFSDLKKKYEWGYNFLYCYAANNKIHPSYIQTLLAEKRYNEIQILKILSQISVNNLLSYSKARIDNMFFEEIDKISNYKNIKIKTPQSSKKQKAIILGNGPSVLSNYEYLKNVIKSSEFTKFFLNRNKFLKNEIYSDFTVVVNTLRLISDLSLLSKKQISLIAPIKKFQKLFKIKFNNKKIINYPVCIKKNNFIIKNNYVVLPFDLALNYALSICKLMGYEEIYFAGIDGYDDERKNYEILHSISLFKKHNKKINLYSLTKSEIISKHIKYINA